MTRIHSIVLTMLLSTVAPTVAKANPCLTDADSVAEFQFAAGLPYRSKDSATTIAAGLPWASRANIQIVSDSTVCAAGIAAFNNLTGGARQVSAAYVFALGETGYAIVLPGDTVPGGRQPIYVFSLAWVHKRNYLV